MFMSVNEVEVGYLRIYDFENYFIWLINILDDLLY